MPDIDVSSAGDDVVAISSCFPSPMSRLAAVDLVNSPRLVPDRNKTAPHAPNPQAV